MSFVLASRSPSRLALLRQIGYIPDHVSPQGIDESERPRELPKDYITRVSRTKAESALQSFPDDIVLGADTIVVTGRRIFQKPETRAEARAMLEHFSGRRLRVITSVCLSFKGQWKQKTITTLIQMKRLSKMELERYLDLGHWSQFSGGIAIDEVGGAFIKSISGSPSNVIGLPLYETKNLLESAGLFAQWMQGETHT